MIGIGTAYTNLGVLGENQVLLVYNGKPITAELVGILVRYRLARAFSLTPNPCPGGEEYCIRSY